MASVAQKATRTVSGAQGGADEKLVRVLEETAMHKILEKLEGPLKGIVHEAVEEAIVHAIHQDGVNMPKGRSEPRSFASTGADAEVRKPKAGGVCEAVWKELDRLHSKKDAVPTLSTIQKLGERKGWNPNNTRVEYYAWRKSNGISGRQAAPVKRATQRQAEQPTAH